MCEEDRCCIKVHKDKLISYSDLMSSLEYLGENLFKNCDPYIESWALFLDSIIESGEITAYCAEGWRDKEGYVFIYRADAEDQYPEFFFRNEVYDILKSYEVTTGNSFEKAMSNIIKKVEFLLECHKGALASSNSAMRNNHNNEYKQTSLATAKKQEKALAKWQQAFRYMIVIRDQCIDAGPKKRTERELWKMFEAKGYEISKTQMAYFKTLLPDGYVDREGGAPRQG